MLRPNPNLEALGIMEKLRRAWLPLLLAPPALIAVLFNAWDFVSLWLDHDKTVEESVDQCTALAREISRYLNSSLEVLEIHMADHVKPAAERFLGGKAKAGMAPVFKLTAQRLPPVAELRVFDASGRLTLSSVPARATDLDIGQAQIFKRHRDEGQDMSIFVTTFTAPGDTKLAKWQLHMAVTLRSEEGDFMGIAVAALDTEAIYSNIGEMKIVTGASVRIFDGDGRLLINHPRDFTLTGKTFAETQTFRAWTAAPRDMAGRLPDPTDNTPEIGAFRRIGRYPLLVSVGIAEDLALAEWWRELAILLATIVVFMLASGWSARRSLARWVLRVKDETEAHGFMNGDGI